jgi:hypothetical protein
VGGFGTGGSSGSKYRLRPRGCVAAVAVVAIVSAGTAVSTSVGVEAAGRERVDHRALDRVLRRVFPDVGTSAVSAAVVFADGSRWAGARGESDPERRRA